MKILRLILCFLVQKILLNIQSMDVKCWTGICSNISLENSFKLSSEYLEVSAQKIFIYLHWNHHMNSSTVGSAEKMLHCRWLCYVKLLLYPPTHHKFKHYNKGREGAKNSLKFNMINLSSPRHPLAHSHTGVKLRSTQCFSDKCKFWVVQLYEVLNPAPNTNIWLFAKFSGQRC